jgi:protein-L-isoaspartate(D-aspartate) O-methyltransferase
MSMPDERSAAKQLMLDVQLVARGIRSKRVLDAIARVPRERFVPAALEAVAYSDRALPIACGQTISQPFIVALMSESLELSGTERVLEIGTGSGYQTAVLAQLSQWVTTVERHAELSHSAAERLKSLGYQNITYVIGDGSLGWPPNAPYDRVLVAAAAPRIVGLLFEQLTEGGILVAPVGQSKRQTLVQIRKIAGQPVMQSLGGCRFVPLVSKEEKPPG